MSSWSWVLVVLLVLWGLAHTKTSRSDGVLRKRVHPYRRLMHYIMPTRGESVVYFDTEVRVAELERYVALARPRFEANMTHCIVAAVNIGLARNPRLNQFVVGRRLYERNGRWLTFSMKRKQLDRRAKLATVKVLMEDGETFSDLCGRINGKINHQRSGKKTSEDKEFDLFNLLPRPLLRGAAAMIATLDYFNLMPGFFLRDDGMYTSAFIANLGSIGMSPGYHHLYEYGTCPLFLMVGKAEDRAVVEDGEIVVRRVLPLRWTYDERIEDGLTARHGIDTVVEVLEAPFQWLGCVSEDGADKVALWPRAEGEGLVD